MVHDYRPGSPSPPRSGRDRHGGHQRVSPTRRADVIGMTENVDAHRGIMPGSRRSCAVCRNEQPVGGRVKPVNYGHRHPVGASPLRMGNSATTIRELETSMRLIGTSTPTAVAAAAETAEPNRQSPLNFLCAGCGVGRWESRWAATAEYVSFSATSSPLVTESPSTSTRSPVKSLSIAASRVSVLRA